MKTMVNKKEIGLLRVLLEETQPHHPCPCISGELSKIAKEEFPSNDDAYNQKVSSPDDLYYSWEPTVEDDEVTGYPIENFKVKEGVYHTDDPLYDYEGEVVQDLVSQVLDNSDNEITKRNTDLLCDLYKLILKVKNTTEANSHQGVLNKMMGDLCDLAKNIWAKEIIVGVEDNKGYYLFTFPGGELSSQVNNIFKIDVLKVLGIGIDERFGDESCIADVKFNQKAPDKYVNGIRVSGYESWKGFKVKHECVDPTSTYFNNSLKMEDLPENKYQRVMDYKLSLASSPDLEGFGKYETTKSKETNQVVTPPTNTKTNINKNDEVGLEKVITNPVNTHPYEDIEFL